MKLRFEWDLAKAASNRRKHGVSLETATRVFVDPYALVEQDRIENGEERWLAIGVVEGSWMLTVAHVVYEHDQIETIRIISARRADRTERRRYEEANG
ncbi:MAG TPA: BrnT family toxin [Acidobacteriaceae bacterium]